MRISQFSQQLLALLTASFCICTLVSDVQSQVAGSPFYTPPPPAGPTSIVLHLASGFNSHNATNVVPVLSRVVVSSGSYQGQITGGTLLTPDETFDTGYFLSTTLGVTIKDPASQIWKPTILLVAGIGHSEVQTSSGEVLRQLDVPSGVACGWEIPIPGLTAVTWVAPRLHLRKLTGSWHRNLHAGFGVGGGLDITQVSGIGLTIAVDLLFIEDQRRGDNSLEFGATAGIHHYFAIW